MTSHGSELQGSVDGKLIRGGTSKGLYVTADELPPAGDRRDELILELFGTPDDLQIDGIGGTHSHTSKIMIVEASDREGVDVDYTFGQVGITTPSIDWSGNCGNLTSGVGVFALLEGLVPASEPTTSLTLYNTNTDTVVEQEIPVRAGEPDVYGEYAIDGVPGTGARIDSFFRDPGGSQTGELLPTGSPVDTLTVDGDDVEVSIVDVANLNVFVRARDLGLEGTELPDAFDGDLLDRIERIRGTACERLGLVDDASDAVTERAAIPQIALVSEPQSYETTTGERVDEADVDVVSRIVTQQTPHHSYAMTGAMCLSAATQVPGTIPNEFARDEVADVTLGHPKGTIRVGVDVSDAGMHVERVRVGRTARLVMDGRVYYRRVERLDDE
jgi:hypothetical protein